MSVYHKADPGELIQWVTHESRSSAASNSGLIRIGTQPRTADAWHHDSCRPRGVVTRDFSAIFDRLFDRLPVRISTSDLYHWILRKKIFHIRAYDFGVQFSFNYAQGKMDETNFDEICLGVHFALCIPKTIGKRKGDCARKCSRWQTQPEKICKLQSTNQYKVRSGDWSVRCNLQIFSGCVCHLERLHAQSPFLFPVVFGNNKFLMLNLKYAILELVPRAKNSTTTVERYRLRQDPPWGYFSHLWS